ncbi:MAG: acyltransferase [Intestinibacter bartlettii]|uniref:acyltransferase family protein n=1 Tax=Intestinibacter bartlettii TaxID=261299 RepID=UPI00242A8EB8|nr:acyltransferase [Intestinibacter bartlettii]MBS7146772.1 acyltransferase [Intestinibacter bartlettii]
MSKKNIVGIDLFKLIAAILIVILHCIGNFFGEIGNAFKINICSIAVPFFFITSGYFYGRGLNRNENSKKTYFIKYEKNLIKMYIAWSLIGIPFMIRSYLSIYGNRYSYIFLLMIRNVFFTGTFGIYWYILAMIGSSILIYYFSSRNRLKLMYILSFLCFIFGILYSGFQSWSENHIIFSYLFKLTWIIFASERNFLMVSWFYMGIGYYLATHEVKINLSWSIVLFILFTGIKFGESYINSIDILNGNTISVVQALQAVTYFLIAINLKLNCMQGISKIMRELSSTIYFTHFLFIDIINPTQVGNTVMTFAEVMLSCVIFYFIIKKINNKKLNILINA